MDYHHDQIEANIPELGGMVVTSLQEIILLNSLVAAFRRSALVVHQPPFIAFPRWRGIETDVGLHGDSAGSAIFGGRARGLTGTGSVVIQRTSKFLHNMQKHVRDAKKKTFDHLWIKVLEFRKDTFEQREE